MNDKHVNNFHHHNYFQKFNIKAPALLVIDDNILLQNKIIIEITDILIRSVGIKTEDNTR